MLSTGPLISSLQETESIQMYALFWKEVSEPLCNYLEVQKQLRWVVQASPKPC